MDAESEHFVETEPSLILGKLQEYFLESEEFVTFLEDWCQNNAYKVGSKVVECRLEFTFLYRNFLRDFEDKLTYFIDRHGGKVEDVMAELAAAEPDSDNHVFAQILSAATDFDIFIAMLSETAQELQDNRVQ
ncbi:Hypothetical Protein FCC1311_068322 [Hondaea fermentalgiana]|uniref:BART domain-containing protein n=1 Tax=Hondaea fermentalgiana TaxID=2315210 RepID=A0A2R5GI98_9STRA|nr:Hypothetical Protein FCC1311_068322 [Hondaea fermentalgiana]|eukprot:GBG30612.1 Hypothetical Protein FCC1311_068322 [Hondaea fermentalgiana]